MEFDQRPPANLEAERAVLGAILLDQSHYDEAVEFLTGDEFSLDANRRIWNRMVELREAGKPIDMILLSEELSRHNEVEAIGGVAYLSSLLDGVPDRPSILAYVKIVREKAMLRGLINVAQTAIAEAIEQNESSEDVLARAELAITRLTENVQERKWATFSDSVGDAGGIDGYVSKILNPVVMSGTPTGYEKLDDIIGGLMKSNLIVIAARPGVGKTSLALNIIQNILAKDQELVVALFSLEMFKQAIESRLLASMAKINLRAYSTRQYGWGDQEDNRRLSTAISDLAEKRLFIDDSSHLTPIRLRSKCRQLKRKEGRLDLAVVDYLQLMSGGGKFENRTQEVSAISRSLKAVAKDLECPVLALSQLSRAVEGRSDKRPILSDLRESGSVEQDADIVVFVHRPEMYDNDPDLEGLAEAIVAKNRDGATGTANLAFIAKYTRFENLAITN